ncbi:MAG: DUF4835 family protein [Bacteroidaceae bacterium]|nr:DUF4835 family protein [Bacteroidaceae bacterium]
MRTIRFFIIAILTLCASPLVYAQEIEAKVNVNHQKIQGTEVNVFKDLQESLTHFINERQWTNLQFRKNERIQCVMNITVNKYDHSSHLMQCTLLLQCSRPVFNSVYTTTSFAITDNDFCFEYQEYDKLEYRPESVDNDLVALVAYYVYLMIGIDMDTMSPLGGMEYLQMAQNVCNNAQSLTVSAKGWKAFDDTKNRYAIISDLMDGGMEVFREMLYEYHRNGLDTMAENAERGRASISEALKKLKQAHTDKPLSMLPQIFTEYKKDELVGIYKGKASPKDKEEIFEILSNINPSMNGSWRQIQH